MKKKLYLVILLIVFNLIHLKAQEASIFPRGEKAPNVHHTGDVWLHHVSEADETFEYNIALATFAPGAILDWHVHPGGQQLLITKGIGYYQERHKPAKTVKMDDVIKCIPGVEH